MKNLKHLFAALLLLCCTIATAEEVTIDGIKYDVVTKAKVATVIMCGDYTGDIVIPSEITHNDVVCSVTTIADYTFSGCSELTSVTIPNSVTSIGCQVFRDCSSLTSIKIPNSVRSIGELAFYYCKNLTNVTIGNSVTAIGDCTFEGCSKLTSVTIPDGVTSIGGRAFIYCSSLTNITIPSCVTSIGNNAFAGCKGLTSIVIPNSVTSIGNNAFAGCSGLTSVTIPNGVTSIGSGVFHSCKNLTSVTIPNSVTSIGGWAFYDCSSLTSIEIPNSVTNIGSSAFDGCKNLTSVTIGNSVTSIGIYAFCRCSSLTSIEIPNSVTTIGEFTFSDCTGLTSVTIGNSITTIGECAFYNSGLTSITIGESVSSVGASAFANCSELADVYCLATTVPSTVESVFENSYSEYMTLHVPAEAINDYKTTAPWSSFGTIVTLDGEEVETPKCATPVISYENGQLLVTCDTDGAEFVTEITNSYVNKYYDSAIDLTATYNISTYATLAGYDNSDIVNATLFWVENGNSDNDTDVINIPATAVLVTSNNGAIYINGALDGENVAVYTTAGVLIGETTIANGNATVQSGLEKGSAVVVKVGEKSVKVVVD